MQCDLTRYWYQPRLNPVTFLLLPFSWLFRLILAFRRWLYRVGFLKTQRFDVPVIVVGNITTGGTGKTPFIIWLAERLIVQGYRPGIVSRGVGGRYHVNPYAVSQTDAATEVGDEALLLANNTGCPVVLCANRAEAVRFLLQHSNCNVVLSDDGLQHYRLGRDINIAIVDGMRRFGNQQLLPAGPLREPLARLSAVDFVVVNEGCEADAFRMHLWPTALLALDDSQRVAPVNGKIHAVAGIGHPARFFQTLTSMGFDVIPHAFPDHYHFSAQDFEFQDSLPVVMTEKDAVKCKGFAKPDYWYLKITAKIESGLEKQLLEKLSMLEK